jgi:hypothetical protein
LLIRHSKVLPESTAFGSIGNQEGNTIMGWSYRKSVNLGPFRINVSKSGVGYSVGTGGYRTGVRANGRRYSSFSIPGTGIRYTPNQSSGRDGKPTGCLLQLAVLLLPLAIVLVIMAMKTFGEPHP